jgi:hypothetical protein
MNNSQHPLSNLSEQKLLAHFASVIAEGRRNTVQLLVAISEIDERKLWAKHACSSMFAFCMQRYHMSESMTAKRIWAARIARRFPVVLGMLECGELHLTAVQLLAKHLTEANHREVLSRAKHKSAREIESLIAEIAPRADVPSRIRTLPILKGASREVACSQAALESASPLTSVALPAGAKLVAVTRQTQESDLSSPVLRTADTRTTATRGRITPLARANRPASTVDSETRTRPRHSS